LNRHLLIAGRPLGYALYLECTLITHHCRILMQIYLHGWSILPRIFKLRSSPGPKKPYKHITYKENTYVWCVQDHLQGEYIRLVLHTQRCCIGHAARACRFPQLQSGCSLHTSSMWHAVRLSRSSGQVCCLISVLKISNQLVFAMPIYLNHFPTVLPSLGPHTGSQTVFVSISLPLLAPL
jgi:hypothetical protein